MSPWLQVVVLIPTLALIGFCIYIACSFAECRD